VQEHLYNRTKNSQKKTEAVDLTGSFGLAWSISVMLRIACQVSMGVMGISKDELLDGLDYGGVGTYICNVCDSKITLFI
jgi:peroxiredoxin family protein